MKTWQLQEAKSKFSQLVNMACSGEPQLVTRNGKPAVYVISSEDYERDGKPSIKETLLNCPHKNINIKIQRRGDLIRDIEL